jgi:hypothetical protein
MPPSQFRKSLKLAFKTIALAADAAEEVFSEMF